MLISRVISLHRCLCLFTEPELRIKSSPQHEGELAVLLLIALTSSTTTAEDIKIILNLHLCPVSSPGDPSLHPLKSSSLEEALHSPPSIFFPEPSSLSSAASLNLSKSGKSHPTSAICPSKSLRCTRMLDESENVLMLSHLMHKLSILIVSRDGSRDPKLFKSGFKSSSELINSLSFF